MCQPAASCEWTEGSSSTPRSLRAKLGDRKAASSVVRQHPLGRTEISSPSTWTLPAKAPTTPQKAPGELAPAIRKKCEGSTQASSRGLEEKRTTDRSPVYEKRICTLPSNKTATRMRAHACMTHPWEPANHNQKRKAGGVRRERGEEEMRQSGTTNPPSACFPRRPPSPWPGRPLAPPCLLVPTLPPWRHAPWLARSSPPAQVPPRRHVYRPYRAVIGLFQRAVVAGAGDG